MKTKINILDIDLFDETCEFEMTTNTRVDVYRITDLRYIINYVDSHDVEDDNKYPEYELTSGLVSIFEEETDSYEKPESIMKEDWYEVRTEIEYYLNIKLGEDIAEGRIDNYIED